MAFPAGTYPSAPSGGLPLPSQNFASPFNGYSNGITPPASSLSAGPFGTHALQARSGGQLSFFDETIPLTQNWLMADNANQLNQDTLMDCLTWIADPKKLALSMAQTNLKTNEYFAPITSSRVEQKDDPRRRDSAKKTPVKAICLPRLNRLLKSKHGRRVYGIHKDFKHVRQDFRYAGGDRTPMPEGWADNDILEKTVAVGGRLRTQDFTPAGNRAINQLDNLYIVWRRMVFYDEVVMEKYTGGIATVDQHIAFVKGRGEQQSGRAILSEIERYNFQKQSKPPSGLNVLTSSLPGKITANTPAEVEYYWEGLPYCCDRASEPNISLYKNINMTGHSEFIGMCTHLHRDKVSSMWPVNAREFISPTTDTDKWKEFGLALPTMVLQLRRK